MKISVLDIRYVQRRYEFVAVVLKAIILLASIGSNTADSHGMDRPDSSQFGPGPRGSAGGIYAASLEAEQPLRPRRLQTVRVRIRDAGGLPVDGAAITVDGGMPQHGHGLPTRPRVTKNLGGGVYEIEGVRFNMGGWWEFTLVISGPAGDDSVTFNLDL